MAAGCLSSTGFPRGIVQYVYFTCLLVLVLLLLFHQELRGASLSHFHKIHILSLFRTKDRIKEKWQQPSALRKLVPFVRGSREGDALRDHPWIRPNIFMTYARPLQTNESHTEVFLYATGVQMGKFERNITVAGCLIGRQVFDVTPITGDVYVCGADRGVEVGEHVSLVLLRDAALKNALEGMVLAGLDVTLQQGDVSELPDGVDIRLKERRKASEYAVLTAGSKVSHVAPGAETIRNTVRYKVCMGTQMKTFAHLLQHWVSYHRKLGVDQVYVLDNAAETSLEEILRGDMSGVETVYWPFEKSQLQAMSFLLVALRERCEWVLLSDADEYVLLGVDKYSKPVDLGDYLDAIPADVEQHYLPYLTMGHSGHIAQPEGPVAEEYLYTYKRQKLNGKTFARTDIAWLSSKIHTAWRPGNGGVMRSAVRNEEPGEGDQGVLVHFQKRSFEEMMTKRVSGSGSVGDLQIGDGKNRKAREHVPGYFRVVDEANRYTFFRDIWRVVEREEIATCLVRGDDQRMV